MSYESFIAGKSQFGSESGFEPLWMPDFLYGFQCVLVEWAIQKGRAAIFADCGMGKSPMQLVWAENVVRKTNKPVLILTPLSVGKQMVAEAGKFGMESERSRDGKFNGNRIVVTNYERLHLFDKNDFAGVVCDESSILKNFNGVRKAEITEFMRTVPYRLLCTATAAPNDYIELGTSAEAIGHMGFQDMLTMFFKQSQAGGHRGWARAKYHLRGHAEQDFWRWVVSWSRSCRKPSDLGFDDGDFVLPPLTTNEHVVTARTRKPGTLFDTPAMDLHEQREERRRTITERCEKVAELIDTDESVVAWCHLNDEGDMLAKLTGGVQVSGGDSDERKEEVFDAFASGQIRKLVTKPKIAGFGMNWQHCCRQTFFPSHSFEQWYQAVRRCWRFGQKNPVRIDVVTSEGEAGVLKNMNRKQEAANRMFDNLVSLMNDGMDVKTETGFQTKEDVPTWL